MWSGSGREPVLTGTSYRPRGAQDRHTDRANNQIRPAAEHDAREAAYLRKR